MYRLLGKPKPVSTSDTVVMNSHNSSWISNNNIVKLTIITTNEVTADNVSIYSVKADVAYTFILSIAVAYLNPALDDKK